MALCQKRLISSSCCTSKQGLFAPYKESSSFQLCLLFCISSLLYFTDSGGGLKVELLVSVLSVGLSDPWQDFESYQYWLNAMTLSKDIHADMHPEDES